jgi:hypothetical protein
LAEVSFVLKAVATLVMSLKKAPPGKGEYTFLLSRVEYFSIYAFLISPSKISQEPGWNFEINQQK